MFPTLLLATAAALAAPAAPAAAKTTAPVSAAAAPPSAEVAQTIGFVSAGTLRARCEETAPGPVSYCFAYIAGVHDTVRAYETWLRFREFCPPVAASQADMRRAFLTYLRANPQSEVGEAASVIVLALKQQFACDKPAR